MNTGNGIQIFDAGGLKVTQAVPEKHIINFWPHQCAIISGEMPDNIFISSLINEISKYLHG